MKTRFGSLFAPLQAWVRNSKISKKRKGEALETLSLRLREAFPSKMPNPASCCDRDLVLWREKAHEIALSFHGFTDALKNHGVSAEELKRFTQEAQANKKAFIRRCVRSQSIRHTKTLHGVMAVDVTSSILVVVRELYAYDIDEDISPEGALTCTLTHALNVP